MASNTNIRRPKLKYLLNKMLYERIYLSITAEKLLLKLF